jgi:hypothetical protein
MNDDELIPTPFTGASIYREDPIEDSSKYDFFVPDEQDHKMPLRFYTNLLKSTKNY